MGRSSCGMWMRGLTSRHCSGEHVLLCVAAHLLIPLIGTLKVSGRSIWMLCDWRLRRMVS